MHGEFPVQEVVRYSIRLHGFSHAPVWIRFPNRAQQSILVHQSPYFLEVHDDRRIPVQHTHVDAPCSFGVTSLPIGSQDVSEVFFILSFFRRTSCSGVFPPIVARAGYTSNLTEHANLQEIAFAPQRFFDDGEFFTGRHEGRLSSVLACLTIFLEIRPPASGISVHGTSVLRT